MSVATERPKWDKKIEFILACVGYAVGLGNVWRFPYLCYKSGGGAFLIPYFIMLFLCGIPLLYMELAVGQYTRQGPIGALSRICPLFKGAGIATVVITFLLTTYYIVIMAWALFYLFNSFTADLPWLSCNHTWSSDQCWTNVTGTETFRLNNSVSSAEDFYNHPVDVNNDVYNSNTGHKIRVASETSRSEFERVLQKTGGIDEPGEMRWELFGLVLLAWVIVYFCIWKGVKSSGKVVYFTATFPYIVLIALFIVGVQLPGAVDGILYFVKPRWNLLLDPEVWVNAAAQNFNSIGIAFGSLIAMASYNKFSNNIFKDVVIISTINSLTSLFAGFVIFSILGFIALQQGKEIDDVVTQGPGLVFVTYPEAFAVMPVPQLWAALFFFMLLLLGIDSQFCMTEVVITTIQDHFGDVVHKYLKRQEVLVLLVCFITFLIGLPSITQGGIYFFQLIDYYSSGVSLMYIAFFETIAICWFYGANRLGRNVREMTGRIPFLYFRVCWYGFSPLLILAIWLFSWIKYKPVRYGDYIYPVWGDVIGWLLSFCSIICIPIGAVHAIYVAKGDTFKQKFMTSIRSTLDEGAEGAKMAEMDTEPPPYDGDEMNPSSALELMKTKL